MAKGFAYERRLCRQLSLWFSNGENDNLFWRTSQSGGRATTRSKKGNKAKQAHAGDICAIDPGGKPLMDLITIEAKRGYNKVTVSDSLDAPKGRKLKRDSPEEAKRKEQKFEEFIRKSKEAAERAGTPFWALIHQRDRREPIIAIPYKLYQQLQSVGAIPNLKVTPILVYRSITLQYVILGFEKFLEHTDPQDVKIILKRCQSC